MRKIKYMKKLMVAFLLMAMASCGGIKSDSEPLLNAFVEIVQGDNYNLVSEHFIGEKHMQSMPGFEHMDFEESLVIHQEMVKENIVEFCQDLAESGIDTTTFDLGDYDIVLGANSEVEEKYILTFNIEGNEYEFMGIVRDNETQKICFGLGFGPW